MCTTPRSALLPLFLAGSLGCFGCEDNPTGAEPTSPESAENAVLATFGDTKGATRIPFADAQAFFEFNSTDNDLGLQIFLDAEGWEQVRVMDPDRENVFHITAEGELATLGITELRFESAEPSPAEVLARFPEGDYRFGGKTVDGDLLFGSSFLSQDLPVPPTFMPADGDVVDPDDLIVRWRAPGAETVEIIVSSEENNNNLDIVVPADIHELELPEQFFESGVEYKIEILSIGSNGNKTITESTFTTK
jgi:hypothetical protein